MLSRELQIGKAAEHLVVFDLLMRGYNAFLADQGLPFDIVVVSDNGQLQRIQVKSKSRPTSTKKNIRPHYRFSLKHAKKSARIISTKDVDIMAFVALDTRTIGYVKIGEITSKSHGGIVQAIDFYLHEHEPAGRITSRGNRRAIWGRFLDDYKEFPGTKEESNELLCLEC
jgi:hypothetical protein